MKESKLSIFQTTQSRQLKTKIGPPLQKTLIKVSKVAEANLVIRRAIRTLNQVCRH